MFLTHSLIIVIAPAARSQTRTALAAVDNDKCVDQVGLVNKRVCNTEPSAQQLSALGKHRAFSATVLCNTQPSVQQCPALCNKRVCNTQPSVLATHSHQCNSPCATHSLQCNSLEPCATEECAAHSLQPLAHTAASVCNTQPSAQQALATQQQFNSSISATFFGNSNMSATVLGKQCSISVQHTASVLMQHTSVCNTQPFSVQQSLVTHHQCSNPWRTKQLLLPLYSRTLLNYYISKAAMRVRKCGCVCIDIKSCLYKCVAMFNNSKSNCITIIIQ